MRKYLTPPCFIWPLSIKNSPPPSCQQAQPSSEGCNCGCLEGDFEGNSPCSLFIEGGSVSVDVFEKIWAWQYGVRRSEAFQNVSKILACSLLWQTAGDGCASPVGATGKWSGCLWVQGSHYRAMAMKGRRRRHGGLEGCWSQPALQRAHQAGDRWRATPCAPSSRRNPSQLSKTVRTSKIAGQARSSSRWVCGMRSKHCHCSHSGGAHSALWPQLIRQASERFHAGGSRGCGPPAWAPQVFHL